MRFLAQAPDSPKIAAGKVRAEGHVISVGRRVAYVEAKLTDAEGRLYATATSTLLVMQP